MAGFSETASAGRLAAPGHHEEVRERYRVRVGEVLADFGVQVRDHRGRLIKATADAILATFDSPGQAIRCAGAILDSAAAHGIRLCFTERGSYELNETGGRWPLFAVAGFAMADVQAGEGSAPR